MTEVDEGIFQTFKRIVIHSSLARAIVYTLGHFLIAMACSYYIAGAPLELAAANAVIEPLINGVWFFAIDKFWASKIVNKVAHADTQKS